ncbi:MAG: hypothetical protein IJ143_09465 [Neisseriaceae bacterium]|nr:hypothetical protein [Neisseriaceae bacterium]
MGTILLWQFIYLCVMIALTILTVSFLLLATFLPKKFKKLKKTFAIMFVVVFIPFIYISPLGRLVSLKIKEIKERPIKEAQLAKYNEAKLVFDEQCKKAEEKIYRTVDNVDGIMLLKVREVENDEYQAPYGWLGHLKDPMYPHAAIGNLESTKGAYIASFLHHHIVRRNLPIKKGYAFVDVLKKDGSISRYFDYEGYGDFDEEKNAVIKNPDNPARYAVTYENNVDPELRKHWIAGITIKIIDRQNDELLAEKTIFSFEPGVGSTAVARNPWARAIHCPKSIEKTAYINNPPTFRFVVSVLKPAQTI